MLLVTQEPQIPDHFKEKYLLYYFSVNQKTKQNQPQLHLFSIFYFLPLAQFPVFCSNSYDC